LQLEAKNAPAVVRALLEMADGLNCLHHKGVIHGDIKPEKVMFDVELPTGRPKWIGFNFSAVDEQASTLLMLRAPSLGLSTGFAPPEFLDGSTDRRTPSSDVYSLGMAYAALLGLPDPSGAGSGPNTPVDVPSSLRTLSLAALGNFVCDSISSLCRLMTQHSPEKRVALTRATDYSGGSVLERLQEVYNLVTSTPAAAKS
jgi:serine/threonine protein kinase